MEQIRICICIVGIILFSWLNSFCQTAESIDTLRITPGVFFSLLGNDFKEAAIRPFHTTKKEWIRTGEFVAAVGALSLADESIQKFSLKLRNANKGVRNVSKYITNTGGLYEIVGLTGLATYGWIFNNNKMKTTTLLAGQAYIVSGAFESVIKILTGRQRPIVVDSTHIEAEPVFHGPFYKFPRDQNGKKTNGSFPSGHTAVAFAAATVYAMEYRDRPLVVATAYTIASLISISRITENKHWTTDVLTGAALGYLSGRLVVNNYYRYARRKSNKAKGQLSLTLTCIGARPLPGLVYTFR